MSWRRFCIVSDLHGDRQDVRAVTAFHAFCKDYKPERRILAGDVWDFRPIRKKAEDHERAESMRCDYEAGLNFIDEFRPQVFLLGNHDTRLWRVRDTATGIIKDSCDNIIQDIDKKMKRHKCAMLPYDKRQGVYPLGRLNVLHGFFCGKFAAKQHAEVYGTCAFGHTHACTEFNVPIFPNGKTAFNIGCLCDLNMEYDAARPNSLAQRHGWAYGVVDEATGDFILHLAKEVRGRYVASSEVQWY